MAIFFLGVLWVIVPELIGQLGNLLLCLWWVLFVLVGYHIRSCLLSVLLLHNFGVRPI